MSAITYITLLLVVMFLGGMAIGFIVGRGYDKKRHKRPLDRMDSGREQSPDLANYSRADGFSRPTARQEDNSSLSSDVPHVEGEKLAESSGSSKVSEIAGSPPKQDSRAPHDLEALCFEFLRVCDERYLTASEATNWFTQRQAIAIAIDDDANGDWHLLQVEDVTGKGPSILVPAIRKTMGGITLGDFYEMVEYNGLHPLRPENLHRFCKQTPDGTVVRGLIDGNQ